MTVVGDVRSPRIEIVDDGQAVRVHLGWDELHSLLITTPAEATALISALGRAFVYLDEQVRLAGNDADKDAAKATNSRFLPINKGYGSLPQAFDKPAPTSVAIFENCSCSRTFVCMEHRGTA